MYDNSAQIWNHNLLWKSLKKNHIPEENLENFVRSNYSLTYTNICKSFKSFVNFIQEIVNAHQKCFGNIWIWIAFDKIRGELIIKVSPNAWTLAICDSLVPLLVIDLWEHSYYLEYRNKKMDFIHKIVHFLNWQLLESRMQELQSL
jgi:Fe-Mn family superoxide dismutase